MIPKRLTSLLPLYFAASLIHFVHNAVFLGAYPNLPTSWTRVGVYGAWLGVTAVGAIGAFLVSRGLTVLGLMTIAIYSMLGMDSLGHYVVAPFSAHTAAMNATILFEVG